MQFPTPVSYSMEALHPDLPIRQLYPEDIYPNGQFRSLISYESVR